MKGPLVRTYRTKGPFIPMGAQVRWTPQHPKRVQESVPLVTIDTVELAAKSPDTPQPWAELGLKHDEYARIRDILGRRPTSCELGMYSVMWSEHCSYKSSKVHLRQFSEK